MTDRARTALTGLQWTLGIVILVEAILFVATPTAHRELARTGMPDVVRLVLGWGEILGCLLLLIPRTAVRGGWFLMGVFLLAIAIHLLHGLTSVGYLVIFAAAAWAVAWGKASPSKAA